MFVRIVMQFLYLSQRGRPDIHTAVSFLCGRLRSPDIDDCKKLGRVLKYLNATIDLPLTLAADGSGLVQWWIDASFAVHQDMKGHTGGTMTLGKGSIYSTSVKQKLVTRIVGVHDVLPQILWTQYLLQSQGYPICKTTLYQDNKSSILLEKNGKQSSSKRTCHMHIRYFFVQDSVINKKITIVHCSSDNMIADYFTKPLQGKLFYKFRNEIMNIGFNSKCHSTHRSVLSNDEERIISDVVENDVANNDVFDATTLSFGTKSNRSYGDALLTKWNKDNILSHFFR
jgi:hypothetical protein